MYKDVICPQLPSLLHLAVHGGSNKPALDVLACEQVLDSVDWCSHVDAKALGFIALQLQIRRAVVQKAIIS